MTSRHNTTQHNTTQHNTTQHNTTQHNTTQHNTTQHNTTQHNKIQHDTTRHGMARHDTTRHNTTQHNTIRCDTTRHDTTQHNTTQHNIHSHRGIPAACTRLDSSRVRHYQGRTGWTGAGEGGLIVCPLHPPQRASSQRCLESKAGAVVCAGTATRRSHWTWLPWCTGWAGLPVPEVCGPAPSAAAMPLTRTMSCDHRLGWTPRPPSL